MDRSLGQGVRKGAWTQEEDDILRHCVERFGEGKWYQIPVRAGLNRCRKSCRLRWLNYLKPNIKRGEFTADEVDLIFRLHKLLGNRWSVIAGRLIGRTANDVKNYWNTHLRKKGSPSLSNGKDHLKLAKDPKHHSLERIHVFKPRPRIFTKNLSRLMISMDQNNINTSMNSNDPSNNNNSPQQVNKATTSSNISSDNRSDDNQSGIKWWESLLADIESGGGGGDEGGVCSFGWSEGEADQLMHDLVEEKVDQHAGKNVGDNTFSEKANWVWSDMQFDDELLNWDRILINTEQKNDLS